MTMDKAKPESDATESESAPPDPAPDRPVRLSPRDMERLSQVCAELGQTLDEVRSAAQKAQGTLDRAIQLLRGSGPPGRAGRTLDPKVRIDRSKPSIDIVRCPEPHCGEIVEEVRLFYGWTTTPDGSLGPDRDKDLDAFLLVPCGHHISRADYPSWAARLPLIDIQEDS